MSFTADQARVYVIFTADQARVYVISQRNSTNRIG
jgi:hypothetical protein